MRKSVIFLFAAMGLLAGCAKEVAQDTLSEKVTLQVGIAPATRTHMGDLADGAHKVYWSDGDKIAVNGVASEALAEVGDAATQANFSFDALEGAPYNVLYPADIWADATHVTLPAVQTYESGGFADGMFPMAAYSADGIGIAMKHLCAVVKVNVLRALDGDDDKLVAARFQGNANEQVSGSFSINYADATLSGASSAAADKVVKVVKVLTTATDKAVSYYIVVPAITYSAGFSIIVQDASGDAQTVTKASSATLEAGKLYNMAEFSFVPNGTAPATLEIASAEDLIAFATAYNNKEYQDHADDFVVSLTADITFDAAKSEAFNAIGGIGLKDGMNANEDYYFDAIFDGNNHTISGLAATAPLFAGVGSYGVVKNFTLANTCSLTVGAAKRGYFAPVVGWNKGLVSGITSHADVTFSNVYSGADKDNPGSSEIGGLVSHSNGGKIVGCSADGTILCPAEGSFTDFYGYVGGIIARGGGDGFKVENCSFGGDIKISNGDFGDEDYGGLNLSSSGECKTFHVGGIVGYLANGTIDRCTTAGSKVIDVRGGFKVQQGGIVGHLHSGCTVSGTESDPSTNRMAVAFRSSAARANTTPTYLGGIVGFTSGSATLTRCTNSGAVSSVCMSTTMNIAGIASNFAGNISYCTNETTGTVTRSDQTNNDSSNRYITMGGIVACVSGKVSISYSENKAQVMTNALTTSTSLTVQMGGVAGGFASGKEYEASFDYCKNTGAIWVNNPSRSTVAALTALGGILGANKKKTTFSNCENDASIRVDYNSTNVKNKPVYIGGIAGLIGDYTLGSSIAGIASVSFSDCTNYGKVHSQNYNNAIGILNGSFTGGIAGGVFGTSTSKASFLRCKNLSDHSQVSYSLRGIQGGIVAHGEYVALDNCSETMTLGGNGNSTAFGGLFGEMVASSAENCTVSASISSAKNVAGFAYTMDATSSISNCKAQGVTLTAGATGLAVFVNTTAAGATITDCGASGTIGGAAITLASAFINTANGVTPTGTYIIE